MLTAVLFILQNYGSLEEFYEHLNGLIFCHTEFIINLRGIPSTFLSSLPELTRVVTRERNDVFLRKVVIYRVAFLHNLIRAERHCHINAANLPFHPCTTVQPYMSFLCPLLAFSLELLECLNGCLSANTVGAVRVCEVTGHIDLIWLNLVHESLDNINIHLSTREFAYTATLIERKVEEVGMALVKTEAANRTLSLRTAYCSFDVKQLTRLSLAWTLAGDEVFHMLYPVFEAQLFGCIHMLYNNIVMYSHVA